MLLCENGQTYIIGAVADGVVYTPQDFSYNGQSLGAYFGIIEAQEVSSPILDTERSLAFYDANGERRVTNPQRLTAQGEHATGIYWLRLELTETPGEGIWVGTYADVDIHPGEIVQKACSIAADMNGDGEGDLVYWELGRNTAGDEYSVNITVEIGGETYVITRTNQIFGYEPTTEILLTDIDLDGDLEIVIYEDMESDFYRGIAIYSIADDEYVEILSYTIASIP